ncbi:Zn-binding Pro-Ala-Ala-Arg (PAAR) domain-containing protein, incolved in TypeVI secretion [Halopseudomonas sabulinigri]|uniref:Zn-binding Pro-Ala-Ala-Arg (PAAR) domain-containing protein, incolved in TypeVI secretion n=1 Tax=Halopseudomonas sabulinigri TaxID=472181 RepID=A0A1H1SIP4_9GAMM|nr:PAAR domain-containing protein [Halopseudomonas sabulinigri]SDS47845.1 Zn-binding Pro-Ala-Ala-Arg (PAAR) domain-containing protein, incolved in TypeVI secretion [Halopseudomonas sabulinigri]
MSGKPAARQGDPTQCPKKGHGSNAIVTGSADVLFDGLPAARLGDSTACGSALAGQVIPNVLINGRPAAVLGTTGSHGDVVIGGSGTVIIGGAVVSASGGGASGLFVPGSAAPTSQLRQGTASETLPFSIEEEEEEDEQELPLQQRITLRVGMFFDGTLNNMNNAAFTAECRRQDLALFDPEELERIRAFCEETGYGEFSPEGRYDTTPDNSYGNEMSNVALLYDLYLDQSDMRISESATEASIRIYIDGIGSRSGGEDDLVGYAFGQGETGVVERVRQSPEILITKLRAIADNNPQLVIEKIEFDIFGFSRGAAAARHFANEVCKVDGGVMAEHFNNSLPFLTQEFAWPSAASINFIGLFDTVAAIGDPVRGDLSVGDDRNPGVNLKLAPDCAKKVVHLTAADEHRHNFSLNKVNPGEYRYHEELILPGVHSNLGGGYPAVVRERVILGKPRLVRGDYYASTGMQGVQVESSRAWRLREAEEAAFRAKGLPGSGRLIKQDVRLRPLARSNAGPQGGDDVLLLLRMDRFVRGDLSKVALHVMYAKATAHNTPFKRLPETPAFVVPDALKPIADKVMLAASSSESVGLSDNEKQFLHGHYIHASANWNPRWELFFPNKPRDKNTRESYEG